MSKDEELLSLYVDDRLGPESVSTLEERLAREEPLRRLLEEMRALQDTWARWGTFYWRIHWVLG